MVDICHVNGVTGLGKGKGKGTVMSDTFSWATCRSSLYLRSQLFSMAC